ncbi:MAG: hypothetical protein H7066_16980 [Cytophagaceae bacterium]|nr:hypothetical protein [Gemmatimonadaceae bacterium]
MKESVLLTRASLLSALLFSVHVTHDLVLGFDKAGPQNLTVVAILLVWVCATLLLAERRSGHALVLLASIFAAAMPILHLRSLNGEFARREGALLFLWTLFALGTSGLFGAILAVRALVKRGVEAPG